MIDFVLTEQELQPWSLQDYVTAVTCFSTREEKDRPVVYIPGCLGTQKLPAIMVTLQLKVSDSWENYHSIKIYKICCVFNLVDFQDDPR